MNKDFKERRQELWIKVWIACCSSSNCTKPDVPTFWADEALDAFDKRFRKSD